jgi:hypothetical protein
MLLGQPNKIMANTNKENLNSTKQEEVEVDVLQPQPNDTPELLAYKSLLQSYKAMNPKKFEAKKEDFIKKIKLSEVEPIQLEEVKGQNGKLVRRTFKVPNIQSKKK